MRILSAVRSWRCSFWSLRAALVWQVSTHTAWPWPAWRGYGEGNPARDHATTMKKGRASDISGGYCVGVPPLPIPNREVKPVCADGTAMQCGRVGGRLLLNGDCSPMRVAVSFFYCARSSRAARIYWKMQKFRNFQNLRLNRNPPDYFLFFLSPICIFWLQKLKTE